MSPAYAAVDALSAEDFTLLVLTVYIAAISTLALLLAIANEARRRK